MAEEELGDEVFTCVACGALFDPDVQRGFPIEEDTVLCAACAVRRGGVYDEERDEWTRPPDISGLLAEPDTED